MQNRFTVKDFFYMTIGAVVCLLLFLNMLKTDNEAEMLGKVGNTLSSQQATLSELSDSITKLSDRPSLDADTLSGLLQSRATHQNGQASASASSTSSAPAASGPSGASAAHGAGEGVHSLIPPPGYKPRYENQHAIWASNVNRRGLPQRWQTASDAELPGDFAPGDTLVMSWAVEPKTLTPMLNNSDAYSTRVWWLTFDYLVNADLDAPFDDNPGLAKAWDVSEDGLQITFYLHEHATWQDGRPVTADDVMFTWDLCANPRIDSSRYKSYVSENVAKWERVDAHTVRFTMKQPYFNAVGVCGNLFPIIPKHVYGDYSEEAYNKDISDVLVGCGPYKLESWVKTKEITLVRNENYWGPKPALERIIIRTMTNELANLQEFWAGNIDHVLPTPQQWVENVDLPKFKDRKAQPLLIYTPQGGYGYLGYNMRRPCFADKRTRQALTMLLDRRALIDTIMGGLGRETTGPFFVDADQYDKTIKPWPYDPARAKALLAEVGWTDTDRDGVLDMDLDGDGRREPFEVTYLINAGSAIAERLQRFVHEAFKQAGINVHLDSLEWSVFIERLNESQFDMVTLSWTTTPEGDPYQIWHSSQAADRGSNRVAYNNPEVDRLIELGRRELNKPKRMDIWHQVHRIIHEDQPYTFLYTLPSRNFVDGRFKNVQPRDYRLYPPEWYVPSADQVH